MPLEQREVLRMKARKLLLAMVGTFGGVLLFFFVGLKVQSRLQAALGRKRACPAACSWVLECPGRIRKEVPLVLERIGVRPGEQILELGCGLGVYTVEAARLLEPPTGGSSP
jgi:hypothetical protein